MATPTERYDAELRCLCRDDPGAIHFFAGALMNAADDSDIEAALRLTRRDIERRRRDLAYAEARDGGWGRTA